MALFALVAFAACGLHAEQASAKIAPVPSLVIEGLGKGTVALSGPWQFHPGDNPAWASPSFDSSGWEQLSADEPWGRQGHASLTGFAWYRCSIVLTPAPAGPTSLLVPKIHDSYEIYWNGALVGRNGKLLPRPVWYISQPVQTFDLGKIGQGVLAVRVWKAPLLSDDSGELGGFDTAPLIGSPEAIATASAAYEFHWLRNRQLHFGANLLSVVIALLSFLLWLRSPARWVLFWMAGFALAQPAVLLLMDAHLSCSYPLAMAVAQPIAVLQDVSLWFLLLWLLALHDNPTISRATRILACIFMAAVSLDGVLVAISWNPQWTRLAQVSDVLLTCLYIPFEIIPLVLVGSAIYRRNLLDSARWLVAGLAFLGGMMNVFDNVVKQGRQFTGWPLASNIDSPLFTALGSPVSLSTLEGALLLVAIVYAVYNTVREDQRRQDALEREKIELLRESKKMRHKAEHDGLTGLWNHRFIVDRLGEEIDRSLREKTPLSAILIDIDHFKKVNDTFGHLAGDLVLREIGAIFTSSLRSYDCVGRYGGEEFLVILPNCGVEGALARAEQLRQAVQSARFMDGKKSIEVTASFGVASDFPSDSGAESVIRAVDEALYRAKSTGRNCIVQAAMDAPLYEN